jgi:response regulator RpfG family c-di-GMP phosphodiesterase
MRLKFMGRQKQQSKALQVVLVDDEPKYLDEIQRVMDGSSGIFQFEYYTDPTSFRQCKIEDIHLLILDMFFGHHRRTEELLDIMRSRWQMCSIIFLTNFPHRIYPGMVEREMKSRIVKWIAKPDFLLHESLLRDAAVAGIRRLPNVDNATKDRAIDHLKRRDVEDSDAETVTEVDLEVISIPLRGERKILYDGCNYSIEGLADYIKGTGETITKARTMFVRRLHEQYQKLFRIRPGFRTAEEQELWKAIVEVVDIGKYDLMRSVTVPYEIGKIVEVRPDGSRVVRWQSGEEQVVTPERAPDIDKLDKGQWFTAVVKRQYITDDVTEILHMTSIEEPEN